MKVKKKQNLNQNLLNKIKLLKEEQFDYDKKQFIQQMQNQLIQNWIQNAVQLTKQNTKESKLQENVIKEDIHIIKGKLYKSGFTQKVVKKQRVTTPGPADYDLQIKQEYYKQRPSSVFMKPTFENQYHYLISQQPSISIKENTQHQNNNKQLQSFNTTQKWFKEQNQQECLFFAQSSNPQRIQSQKSGSKFSKAQKETKLNQDNWDFYLIQNQNLEQSFRGCSFSKQTRFKDYQNEKKLAYQQPQINQLFIKHTKTPYEWTYRAKRPSSVQVNFMDPGLYFTKQLQSSFKTEKKK